jgi:NAD(P)-dependent dehydrogenase (short-subunit alcohol dehydrogenase family)
MMTTMSTHEDVSATTALPSFRLDGKVALVTGGSKGLGRAMALGFAAAGADVVVASRKAAACEEVAAQIRALGRRAAAVACHVGSWVECEELVDRTLAEMGRLDVLVNNAGIAPVPPSLDAVTEELFDKTVAVNLKGPLRLSGVASRHMTEGGSIINISSVASVRPSPHTVVYAAAKAGLNVLTKASSQELGPRGIRVNCIICGTFHTDSFDRSLPTADMAEAMAARLPLGRIASADEIVGTALFLASDASSYMTGALLSLDGGVG